jgi:hypothetical protein
VGGWGIVSSRPTSATDSTTSGSHRGILRRCGRGRPYRSYGAWYQVNRGGTAPPRAAGLRQRLLTSTVLAARSTAGLLLERGGAVARPSTRREQLLSLWLIQQRNSDPSCGDGSAGSPAAGWSCLADPHAASAGPGRCCFGHGRDVPVGPRPGR